MGVLIESLKLPKEGEYSVIAKVTKNGTAKIRISFDTENGFISKIYNAYETKLIPEFVKRALILITQSVPYIYKNEWHCMNCDKAINEKTANCPNCGQKLDWSNFE